MVDASRDAPTLRDLVDAVLGGWRLLLAGLLAGFVVTVAVLWLIRPEYTAGMLVAPTTRIGPSGMGPVLPPGSGHAGRSLTEPGPGELLSDFSRYLELIASVPVAARLLEDRPLMIRVFEREWDAEAGTWRPPGTPVALMKRLLHAVAGREGWAPPDAERLAEHLRKNLQVGPSAVGPVRRVSYRHPDRDFAIRFLTAVHTVADGLIREEAGRRTEAGIDYIRARLQDVAVTEHRKALADLLADQERTRMMIDIALPFAADVIAPASAPVLPDWPNPVVLPLLGAICGFCLALAGTFARSTWGRGLW